MLKSRLFVIISMILIILSIFNANCSAFSVNSGSDKIDFGDVELSTYNVLVKQYNLDYYKLYCSPDEIYIFPYPSDKPGAFYLRVSENSYWYTPGGSGRVDLDSYNDIQVTRSGVFDVSEVSEVIIYSDFDIKDEKGNVVFPKSVLPLGVVLEKTNPVQMFQTMTHGMIVSLVAFLVGLVAFWKAWSFLLKNLRKA